MKIKIYSLLALGVAVGMASCSDNWAPKNGEDQYGQVAISTIDVVNSENVISRASTDVSDFIVTIQDSQGAMVSQWIYSQMPELVTLPVGEGYTVKVISHIQEKQAWDKPYFEGVSEKFAIENNKITQVDPISCKLANIKVSIRYSDQMKKAMGDDCRVTVVANDEGRLVYTPDETRAGYFQAVEGSSTLVATFTGTVNGYYEELREVFTDVEAGQHRIITYRIKTGDGDVPDETGGISIEGGIAIDSTTVDESVEGNVAPGEDVIDGDRPGKEDPVGPEDPDVPTPPGPDDPDVDLFQYENGTDPASGKKSNIDFDGENTASFDDVYVVDIFSVNPLAHLNVEIISMSLSAENLAAVGLPSEFDLADPQPFTKPDGEVVDLESTLRDSFGFPVKDQVVGQTAVTFNITQFVPLLLGFPDETHTFKLTLTDDKGNVEVLNLIFKS